jgi:hypothetical protein
MILQLVFHWERNVGYGTSDELKILYSFLIMINDIFEQCIIFRNIRCMASEACELTIIIEQVLQKL